MHVTGAFKMNVLFLYKKNN